MDDLTVIYLTMNRMPESWVTYHKHHLLGAVGGYPVISISREPIDIGQNLIDDDEPGYANIYRQLLRGAKMADTPFVAMAEDDVLYSPEHFREFRPRLDEVAYNRSRWSVFAWDRTLYSLRNRVSNCTLIAPRDYLIDALEERFTKAPLEKLSRESQGFGEVGRHAIERSLGVTPRNMVEYWSWVPVVHLSHIDGTEERQTRKRKRHAQIRAYDIPYWGKASTIVDRYIGG